MVLNLDLPIIAGEGIGDVKLGQSLQEFIALIRSTNYSEIKIKAYYPFVISYTFFNSITLNFNAVDSKLFLVEIFENYQGLYQDKVGVGSYVKELADLHPELIHDEEFIGVKQEGWNTGFRTDHEDHFNSIEEALDKRIIAIRIQSNSLAKT